VVENKVGSKDDPAGKGRVPHLELHSVTKNRISDGEFWWGEEKGHGKSTAEIRTSNNKVQFTII